MTWEQIILKARTEPKFKDTIFYSYLEEDNASNANRYRESEEFAETLRLVRKYCPMGNQLLDVGCGNGISTIAFALNGFSVTAIDPDPSRHVGLGAVSDLLQRFKIENVSLVSSSAENFVSEGEQRFDVIFARQALHHAGDLRMFVANLSKCLKPGGLLLTVRDHVANNEEEKEAFLSEHPFHKYYGGENAYSVAEYLQAFNEAGFTKIKAISHFESPINYFPLSKAAVRKVRWRKAVARGIKAAGLTRLISQKSKLYHKVEFFSSSLDECNMPGRLYSFVVQKD